MKSKEFYLLFLIYAEPLTEQNVTFNTTNDEKQTKYIRLDSNDAASKQNESFSFSP